jgi:hypothetical protein
MLTSIEGIYEDGQVRLLDPLPGIERARVVVTLLPESMAPLKATETPAETPSAEPVVERFEPRSELGRTLLALRRKYVEGGGKLVTVDEIMAEVREGRCGSAQTPDVSSTSNPRSTSTRSLTGSSTNEIAGLARAAREAYLASGGQLTGPDEIAPEVRRRRGGVGVEQIAEKARGLGLARRQLLSELVDFLLSRDEMLGNFASFPETTIEDSATPSVYQGEPLSLETVREAVDWQAGSIDDRHR